MSRIGPMPNPVDPEFDEWLEEVLGVSKKNLSKYLTSPSSDSNVESEAQERKPT